MVEKVKIDDWQRKNQYKFFSVFTNPYASVTSIINVDKLVNYAKSNNISFYGLMSFEVLKAINSIEEFKYVLDNDGVYKYDKINITFSVLKTDNKLNFSRTVEFTKFTDFMEKFILAKQEAESDLQVPYTKENNKIYVTCTPWMRITSIGNPMNYTKIDSIPRICWGKYFLTDDGYNIDLSIQVNHAFQDGYHLGLFLNTLQQNIYNLGANKNEKRYTLHRSR